MNEPISSQALPELFRRAYSNLLDIVELYVALARKELREDLRISLIGAGLSAAGGFLVMTALTAFLIAGIVGMATMTGWPIWLIALLTGLGFLLLGALLMFIGAKLIRTRPLATTREALQEGIAWFKEQQAIFGMKSPGDEPKPAPSPSKSSTG